MFAAHHFTPPPPCNFVPPPIPINPNLLGGSTRCFQGVPLSGAAGTPCSRHHSHMGEGHMAPSPRAKPPVKPFKPSPPSRPLHTNTFANLLTRWIPMPTLSNLARVDIVSPRVYWSWWALTRRGPPSHVLRTGGRKLRYRELFPRPPRSRTGPVQDTRAASTVRSPPHALRTPSPFSTRVLRARANPGPFAGFPFPDGPSHRSGAFEEMQTSRNGEGAR